MYYKVLYHDPKDLIEYAKWLNVYYEEGLRLIAINGNYHIFISSQPSNSVDTQCDCKMTKFTPCPHHRGDNVCALKHTMEGEG